ncbi:ArnT family glycosyltransferase [Pyrococcus abyssi]|uniref:Glycosyl transferase, family 39 n=1 Tax=Pyrococcus abyssi (strain GE5 / Orsay) TaxID=272844 RepID=Q9V2H8_PYRAB|nr:glycosyltransferase family 39 protein [Pyrococcus abyssi]CAB49020.1 Glycosyl transferase, family 39 [Pyrococcus abyssi GE5]CCE69472.1 TPA: hypothetical protein PAB0056 [Pyrococcus abyssi GE5]
MKAKIEVLVFLGALILGILSLPPENSLTYDGALYIDIARNLAKDLGNFTYQGIYMMYRPPLYPYTLSIPYRLVDSHHLIIARLVSVISFSLTAIIVYILGFKLFNSQLKGVIASLFYMLNPLAFTMASRELVHSEFTLFYALALYLLYTGKIEKNRVKIYLAFISSGLAVLTRYTGLSIILVIFAYLWLTEDWRWVKRKEYIIGFLLFILTLIPWLYMGHLHYGGALRPFKIASRVVTLDKPVSAFDYLKMILKDIGYVLPGLAFLGFLRLKKDEKGWLMLSWLLIGGMGILSVTHKETRFITFLSPVIALLATEGINLIEDSLPIPNTKKKGIIALVISFLLLIPIGIRAKNLRDSWSTIGIQEMEVLRYVSMNYGGEKIIVPPRLYTMAGYWYPDAKIDMILNREDIKEKLSSGYYDVVICRNIDNLELSDDYQLIKEFYGRFKIYVNRKMLKK